MRTLDRHELCTFASQEIVKFHESRLQRLRRLSLNEVLIKKNPYLFRAKDMNRVSDLVYAILNAFLSSSEEELFGKFLEELAIHVAQQTCDGRKSSAQGIDLELDRGGTRYLVAIKSGPNWGNSSQYRRLEQDFKNALAVQKQSHRGLNIRAVLGCCYGKAPTRETGTYTRIVGQNFWYFLAGGENLYIDIIEPIGFQAKRHNMAFEERKDAIANQLIAEFMGRFCKQDYAIDWPKLVAFNSGNLGA